jgi:tryptophan-rich sensory protein
VAWFGGQFMPGSWYAALAKPSWTPPGWLFPPVWTFLYASMAVAAWLIWRGAERRGRVPALVLFFGQLVLNGLWSWFFFGEHLIGVALFDIVLLLVLILAATLTFWRLNRLAGILFIPYLLWVSFATALNFAIWRLN